jgi:Cdc6-like AAA superfamily ATPase
MSNKKARVWSWRSLQKRHSFRYETYSDNSLESFLLTKFRKLRDYLSLSFLDLGRSLRKSNGSLWLLLSLLIVMVALFHLNSSKVLSISPSTYASQFIYQFIAAVILFIFLYKIKIILNFLWLITGPNLRWLRLFLALELISIVLAVYSLLPGTSIKIANSIGAFSAGCAVVVSIIGSIRQWKFVRYQKLLSQRSQLIVGRAFTEDFEINGQQGSALRLKNIVKNEKNPQVPITVLVDGKWGDGKTYLVDYVIDSLTKSSSDYVIVRFEPWRHVSEEAIVTSFYGSLGSELSNLPGSTGVQFDIAALSRNFVSKIDKTGTIESLLTQLPQRRSSPTSLKKAERLLTDAGKRLVFIIDDVERCGDKNRILRTLQLGLHLGADIKNSTTIVIGDIQEIIEKTDVDESFLQKIIDEQITILPPTKEEMLDITNSLMKCLPLDIQITQDQRLDLLVRNVRGIKRVLNGVSQDYLGVGDNIHPQDLFAINVIRHAFPTIYADIMQNRSFYVPFQYKDYTDEAFRLYGLGAGREDSDFTKDQAEHLTALMKGLKLSDIRQRRLISVLEELFPATKSRFEGGEQPNNNTSSRQQRRERRIGVSIDYIDRYFLLSKSVDKRHIIEESQAKMRDSYFTEADDETRLQYLRSLTVANDKDSEELFYSGLADSLADLPHKDPNRRVLARDMLRLYFRNTNRLVRDDKQTLLIILNAINDYVDRHDYNYIFANIAKYMQHPSTGLRLLLYINPTRQNSFYGLKSYEDYNELRKKILSKIDTYYLDQGNDIIEEDDTEEREWRFTIAQWSTSVCYDSLDEFIDNRFKKVNDYLMRITESSPEKFHNLLMNAFWHQDMMSEKAKFNFTITPQAYDIKKFAARVRKLVKQKNLSGDILSDLQNFLAAYDQFEKEPEQK